MRKLIGQVIAALLFAGVGCFALYTHRDVHGLYVGVGCVVAALGIAFPAQLHAGTAELKGVLVLILPTVFGAIKGGKRDTDPPADDAAE